MNNPNGLYFNNETTLALHDILTRFRGILQEGIDGLNPSIFSDLSQEVRRTIPWVAWWMKSDASHLELDEVRAFASGYNDPLNGIPFDFAVLLKQASESDASQRKQIIAQAAKKARTLHTHLRPKALYVLNHEKKDHRATQSPM